MQVGLPKLLNVSWPWQRSLGERIATVGSGMQELHEAGHARLWLFTSVSVRNGLVGTGLVVRVNHVDIVLSNRTVGNDDALNAHYAQLGGGVRGCLHM